MVTATARLVSMGGGGSQSSMSFGQNCGLNRSSTYSKASASKGGLKHVVSHKKVVQTHGRLDPSFKEAYIELLHKKDMKEHVSFCDLSKFGDMIVEKEVRDRAITDRIEAAKSSSHMMGKFEK